MTEQQEIEILLATFSKEELARMYLLRLHENERLLLENQILKKEINDEG
jgi:hypothetical protein